LCGEDKFTRKNYEYRRNWVEDKLIFITDIFAIDMCAYAIMSNHHHLVYVLMTKQASEWSIQEMLERWHKLFKETIATQQFLRGEKLIEPLQKMVEETAQVYRYRPTDMSWFMRILNESIAKQANQEDECTGRFWEGRFKSQVLLDEAAMLACMAYVDLNPIRAKMAITPETSDYSSIKERIKAAKEGKQPESLIAFVGNPRKIMSQGLPSDLTDYIKLVDLTGRCIRQNKPGYIDAKQPAILARLNISTENWLILTTQFRKCFHGAVGHVDVLTEFYQHQHLKKRATLSVCKRLLA
jgi:REP element-mobilizing transposase RayT